MAGRLRTSCPISSAAKTGKAAPANGAAPADRCGSSESHALHAVAAALIEGAVELGIPAIDDPNGATNEGAAPSNFNICDGKRFSSARAYLWPVLDNDNLTVLPDSLVTRLGFEGRRSVSVMHLVGGREVETRASIEIIMALGAIDTPRLLMLSGVGDPAELGRLGIAVKAALSGVGRNLQDHPLVRAVNFKAKRPLGAVSDNGGGSMLNWKTSAGLSQPNVHAFPVQGRSAVAGLADKYDLSGDVFAIGTGLMRSRSRGYLRLLGTQPGSPIEIQPNFLCEPEDVSDLVDAVDLVMGPGGYQALRRLVRRTCRAGKAPQRCRRRAVHPHGVFDVLSHLRHREDGRRQFVGRR
jgi:choline dehydrogenase